MRRFFVATLATLAAALATVAPRSCAAAHRGATALGDILAGLGNTARVLVIAAHPDDEDTRLITWLTKGHHVDVAYLSLTRGDGGQNLIGNELGEALGVIRTEELLAARRLDGAHQYFTRAYDFGFSKTAAETFQHWPHDSLLVDVVTVIRAFKPQIVVAVFSGTPRDGHGQHQVSGILAREAYDAAGDGRRFPASTTQGLPPWTPLKFYRSSTYWGGEGATFTYNAGEYNPLLGMSYAEIAALSRSQHKSQGFGALQRKGAVQGSLRREDSRVPAPSDASAEKSIFDGIDTTWAGLAKRDSSGRLDRPTVDSIGRLLTATHREFDPYAPSSVAMPLGQILALARSKLQCVGTDQQLSAALKSGGSRAGSDGNGAACHLSLPSDGLLALERLEREATRAELLASGVAVEAFTERDLVATGDSATVTATVYARDKYPVAIDRVETSGSSLGAVDRTSSEARVRPDSSATITTAFRGGAPTQPWWLATPRRGDMFTQPVSLTAEDRRPPAASLELAARNQSPLEFTVPIVDRAADPVRGEITRPLAVAPAVSVTLDRAVEYVIANGAIDRSVRVSLRSASTASRTARVTLQLPQGLKADSITRTATLPAFGSTAEVDFHLRGTLAPGRHVVKATVESGGQTFAVGYQLVEYDHIRPQRIYRDAVVALQAVDVKLPPGANVAYIPGVGDNVAPMLQELGLPVTVLDPSKLATTNLAGFTQIVIGTRAYESQPALVANNGHLLEWVRNGGTMVVQYGQYEMTRPGMMPYPITLTRPAERVTDENAPVRILKPNDALLNTPNRIGDADWAGWVQERGLYMPSSFDAHYASLLSMNDPNEKPNDGAVLVAAYGRGTYVYTTLSFFRQLPAGVPGAARLFANLLAARQPDAPITSP